MFFVVYIMNKQKIEELNQRYNIILNEFTHIYPSYKTFPDVTKFTQKYATDNGNLTKLQAEFFQFKDNLQTEITKSDRIIKKTDIQIQILEKKIASLKKEINYLENDNEAAEGMLDDVQLRYNQFLVGNWILLIVLIGSVSFYYKIRS